MPGCFLSTSAATSRRATVTFRKMPGQLVDLGEPVDSRQLRLEDRQESGGEAVQRPIGRNQGRDLPDPAAFVWRRRGIRPARTTDDLPLPDAPTTATREVRSTASTSFSVNASRPKKKAASSSRNGRRPR